MSVKLIKYIKRYFSGFLPLLLLASYFLFNQLYFLDTVVLMIVIWLILLYLQAKAESKKTKAEQIKEYEYNKVHTKQLTTQLNMARLIADNHAEELAIRRALLAHKSRNGLIDAKQWEKELKLFTLNFIQPVTGHIRGQFGENYDHLVRQAIEDAINDFERHSLTSTFSKTISPSRYEQFVASILADYGWKTRMTAASDDQGIDLIAEKQGIKVVLQCKLYSNNVGDAAVQKIIAGKAFEKANFAAIVSNAGFTDSAKQLASSAGVFLLHHEQLEKLETMCTY